MGYMMRDVFWAAGLMLFLCCTVHGVFCSQDQESLPGVFDVISNGQLAISVMDMHRYDAVQGGWLVLGLVVKNEQDMTTSVDPVTFKVLDNHGEEIQATNEYPLKNPLERRDVEPGGIVVGSLGFKIEAGANPVELVDKTTGLKIRLDKAAKPPGTSFPPGVPVVKGSCTLGIEGISRSEDGRMLRIDYLLENSGPGVMLLEPRDYGRFGILIDASGWSYAACDYKMLGPAVPPGASVEGYMVYKVPDGSDPQYLLFWPPNEDAILFDLSKG
jgi:hypothetical protein